MKRAPPEPWEISLRSLKVGDRVEHRVIDRFEGKDFVWCTRRGTVVRTGVDAVMKLDIPLATQRMHKGKWIPAPPATHVLVGRFHRLILEGD